MRTFDHNNTESSTHTTARGGPPGSRHAEVESTFIDRRPASSAQRKMQETVDGSARGRATAQLMHAIDQQSDNRTGLPDSLKSGVEALSGMSLDHVRVHYNSPRPAQLHAHAFAQASDIHVAPGQERHVPHEAWHVVQQAQGRVRPTLSMRDGVQVNDDQALEHEADTMGARALQFKTALPMMRGEAPRRPGAQASGQQPVQLFSDKQKRTLKAGLLKVENDEAGANRIIALAESLGASVEDRVLALVGTGKLYRLAGLYGVLDQIRAAAAGAKDEGEAMRNTAGYIWELNFATMAAEHDDVDKVQLGAIGGVGGDIVARGTSGELETMQVKLATGNGAKAVKDNIRKGIRQLGGSGGETADSAGNRVVDVTVLEPTNLVTLMTDADRLAALKSYIYDVDCTNVDFVFVRFSMPDGSVKNYSFDAKDRDAAPDVTDD